ncbi:MAG: helix-turn-helix domain-containing protein [Oscillospiraceae bacterium]|nr:helix-turn-helix domain-containing protein [Oscillospiraceae bacterium]MDY3258542.1 helix-turn-helix domain-containing protein [Ruminococcus callidus]
MNVFESIMTGLNEAVEYEKGNLTAKKTTITVEPLPEISAEDIKNIRNEIGLTQSMFAAVIGVSVKTVEAWEAGTNRPIGPARRMISLIQFNPDILKVCHVIN